MAEVIDPHMRSEMYENMSLFLPGPVIYNIAHQQLKYQFDQVLAAEISLIQVQPVELHPPEAAL